MKTIPVSIVIPYKEVDGDIKIWMQVRKSLDDLSGRLEFPGGKIEKNETPKLAAIREVEEEVGVKIKESSLQLASIYNDKFDDKIISIYVFIHRNEDSFDSSALNGHWYGLKERDSFWSKMPPANQVFLGEILEAVKSNT